MAELVLAMLAGALLMGVAVELFRMWDDVQRERAHDRSRRRLLRDLDRWRDEVDP